MVESDKVYLIILLQTIDQTALDHGTDANQTRGSRDGNLGCTETVFQTFALGLFM